MKLTDRIHGAYISDRRAAILTKHLIGVIPPDSRILDIGSGDGRIASSIVRQRSDVAITGLEVLIRANVLVPTLAFDGCTIPYDDDSFDGVMLIDVLHHTDDPMILLREAVRVARSHVIVKDHLAEGWFQTATLRFMDRIGNQRHGVPLAYNYWTRFEWEQAMSELSVTPEFWQQRLRLYGWPAGLLFDRSLHFLTRLVSVH